ncbi:MAG: DISARM system helicase DrmA [Streptosporangiaceae bacterium]
MTEDSDGTGATSFQVRSELEELLERDLLGPWDGPDEELPPGSSPAEQYLLGRLVPRDAPADEDTADQDEDSESDQDPALVEREVSETGDSDDSDVESEAVVRSGSMAASALGMSFLVPDDTDTVLAEASWGRYERVASEIRETEQGRPRTVWKRSPGGGQVEVPLVAEGSDYLVPDPRQEGVVVHYTVRHRGRRRVVELALVNGQPAPEGTLDTARLYQAGLTATALDGHRAVFLGHNDPKLGDRAPDRDDERLHLALLHRRQREYAHGRQCAVDADVRDGEDRAWRLATTCFPAAEVPLVVPGRVPGLELDMARLGSPELARDELVRALRPLVSGYRTWLDAQQARLGSDAEVARYAPAGEQALEAGREVAARLDRAIGLLRGDGIAREAFRFANQAMALQRVRGEVVRARLADPSADVARLLRKLDVPENRSWRPFQLAFVLLCLPGLTDPGHRDARRGADDALVQLLFFPTGGGKTEAYLGLSAYTFAIRRLQGVVGDDDQARDGTRGVAVLMRYTLRLLTAQQFQRAAALVCACEWLRRERVAAGDLRWGTTPFRVGLWVGSSVTPNSYEEARRQVSDSRQYERSLGGPMQLAACPWCGSPLSGSRDLSTHDQRRRVLVHWSDPEGDCLFTPRNSPGEGLPVLTVDEEIYRLTPALVIATVDKLAQLPWRAATAPLFGLVDSECPRHGWQNSEFAGFCRTRHPAVGDLPPAVPVPAMRLRPPDLIIQDELHLISDALGSMVGLYETVIDRLCTRQSAGGSIRPVLVASTATVRRARDQVEQVFARGLAVFPPQVIDAGETFFSSTVAPAPDTPGRRYRGVLAPGERLKSVEIRVVTALLEHAQFLLDRHGPAADPYMTLVDYFTSTRELAGMRRLVDDDIADRLASQQVRTRRRRPSISELTSRMPSSRIAATLAELERRFDPSFDSSAALEEFRRDPKAARERSEDRLPALDVLLATSMLQVGVDVQRLGLMVVTGQPKNTAEYIQATSRIGRDRTRPGLVMTIYQWTRPRDLAHLEAFGYDHSTFGLKIEGLTTTPFSDRALDRGLTGVLVTAMRHSGMAALANTAAQTLPLAGPSVTALLDEIRTRAERVTHDSAEATAVRGSLQHRLDSWSQQRRAVTTGRLGYEVGADITGLLVDPDTGSWDLWSAPRSLREVEPQISLQLDQHDRSLHEAPAWSYDRPPLAAGHGPTPAGASA